MNFNFDYKFASWIRVCINTCRTAFYFYKLFTFITIKITKYPFSGYKLIIA